MATLRNVFMLAALAIVSTLAIADPIPSALVKTVQTFDIEESGLSDGVLRVRYRRAVVTRDMFRSFVGAACRPLAMSVSGDSSGWRKARIDRIEVVNQIGAQGFAFVGGRPSCSALDPMGGVGTNDATFAKYTWVCVAGAPCRPRRDGERTSGDE